MTSVDEPAPATPEPTPEPVAANPEPKEEAAKPPVRTARISQRIATSEPMPDATTPEAAKPAAQDAVPTPNVSSPAPASTVAETALSARVSQQLQSRTQRVLSARSQSTGARAPGDAEEGDGSEQRFARRRPAKTKAFIIQPNRGQPIPCVVRDTSSGGALIHLTNADNTISRAGESVSARFILQMPLEHVEVDCEIAWRRASKIGVRYIGPTRVLAKPERRVAKADPVKPAGIMGRILAR